VFYFGNAMGETGNSAADAIVDEADKLLVRDNPCTFLNPAMIGDVHDFNRDRKVNATDELIARDNGTTFQTALKLITAPGTLPAAPPPLPGDTDGNNAVDADDMGIFWSMFGRTGDNLAADFNTDGMVDIGDFAILRANFGRTQPQPLPARAALTASEPQAVPVQVASSPAIPVTGESVNDSSADNARVVPAVSGLAANLPAMSLSNRLTESRGTCTPEPWLIVSATTTLYRAATAAYDLRTLGDDILAGRVNDPGDGLCIPIGADDPLSDLLVESLVTVPL